MKTCSICKKQKNVIAFYKDARLKSGLASRCKECSAALAKVWFANNAEKAKASNKAWQINNREKYRNNEQKRRARKQASGEYLVLEKEMKRLYRQKCFYCGANDQITVDHIIPISRGGRHSIGNLLPACKPCNQSKHKKTITEWKVREQKK